MLYEYQCLTCEDTTTLNLPVAERNSEVHCKSCGGDTKRLITGGTGFTPVMGACDNPGYKCPVTDQWIDSKKKRQRVMDEHNLVEAGDTKPARC